MLSTAGFLQQLDQANVQSGAFPPNVISPS